MTKSTSETQLVVFIRKIPAKWVAKVPWVVIVTQCVVILLLLLDPTRQNMSSPVMEPACNCLDNHDQRRSYYGDNDDRTVVSGNLDNELLTGDIGDFTIRATEGKIGLIITFINIYGHMSSRVIF